MSSLKERKPLCICLVQDLECASPSPHSYMHTQWRSRSTQVFPLPICFFSTAALLLQLTHGWTSDSVCSLLFLHILVHHIADVCHALRTKNILLFPATSSKPNTTTGSSWLLRGPCNLYSGSTPSSFSGLTGQHVTLSTHRPWAALRTSPLALPSPEHLHELPSVSFRPHGGLHTSKSHTLVNTSQLTHFLSSFPTSTYHLLT